MVIAPHLATTDPCREASVRPGSGRSASPAEQVHPDRDAADYGLVAGDQDLLGAGLAGHHVDAASMLQPPAHLFDLPQYRTSAAPPALALRLPQAGISR